MAMLTKEQYESLTAESRKILENLAEGQSARDIMAQIYVDNLEDKTIKQGELMADGILQCVKNFDAGYQAAQEDLDGFLEDFQQKAEEGKNCVERCNYWLKLSAAIATAQGALEDGADRDAMLQELEGLDVSEEEATPEREIQLRATAAEAIKNSHLLLGALMKQNTLLDEMDNARDTADFLIEFGNQEIEYRAVVAMLAYTKIKNGTFEGLPADITAEQVTAMVCAGIEEARILDEVGKGKLSVDVATVLLGILGVALLAALAFTIATGGIVILVEIAKLLWSVFTGLFIALVIVGLAAEGAQMVKMAGTAVIHLVGRGATAVIDFAQRTILPKMVQAAQATHEKLASLCEKTEKHIVEVTAE